LFGAKQKKQKNWAAKCWVFQNGGKSPGGRKWTPPAWAPHFFGGGKTGGPTTQRGVAKVF